MHYDVFTDRLFGGNQLAVVLDGRGLTTDTMLAIAKEMNFSETTFVLPAEQSGTDARLRIFTPGEELPTAGHPTIGSTFALARAGMTERGQIALVAWPRSASHSLRAAKSGIARSTPRQNSGVW